MLGVIANALAIVVGTLVGLFLKRFISQKISENLEVVLGLVTLLVSLKMALESRNVFVMLASLCLGAVIGTMIEIEARTQKLISRLIEWTQRKKPPRQEERSFSKAFCLSSLLFCTGAMAILGSIKSGVGGDHEILFTKAVLDGTVAVTFATLYGFGVLFSAIPVLVYQGSIVLMASHLKFLSNPAFLAELSGVGGVLLAMIGLNLSLKTKYSVADFLPSLPLCVLFYYLGEALKVYFI